MIKRTLIVVMLFFITQSLTSQITGFVKNNDDKKPIPYVNIWVENENIGTTSDVNGKFLLPKLDNEKNLVLSAIGYETKNIGISDLKNTIYLIPIVYELSEVTIHPNKKPVE